MGVGCGRDVDEALESFPFVLNVSLLRAVEEKAGAEILGILLAGAGEGERSWLGELGRLRPRAGEEGRLRARFIALSSSTLSQKITSQMEVTTQRK